MSNMLKSLGSSIRAARRAKGWTQTQLALESGVSFRGVQDIETGKRSPRPATLEAIAGALGMTSDVLISQSVGKTPATSLSRGDILIRIMEGLPTLNDSELRTVETTIEDLLALRPTVSRARGL